MSRYSDKEAPHFAAEPAYADSRVDQTAKSTTWSAMKAFAAAQASSENKKIASSGGLANTEETDSADVKPPTILVVHASVGSGHRSASIGIAQAFEELRDSGQAPFPDGAPLPKGTNIEIIDILDYSRFKFDGDKYASSFTGATRPIYDINWRYSFTGRLLWGGGSGWSVTSFPRFTKYVREVKPLAIVCTHIAAANCAVGARMITHQNYPVISVPTDYETEGLWPHTYTDAFCVGTEYMAETLRAREIPENKLFITGIPTRSDFRKSYDHEQARRDFNLPEDKTIVLALAGAHLPMPYVRFRENLDEALPYLHRYPNLHLVIIAGKDKEYSEQVRTRCADLGLDNVTVYDYCTEMAKLMSASDLVICKAGGLTVTECLCSSTPMILLGKAYGQEKANVNMLTGNGAAIHVTTARELREALEHFSNNKHLLDSMLMNANLLRHPNAAKDIVEITMKLVADRPYRPDEVRADRHPYLHLAKLYWGKKPAHIR